MKHHPPLFVLIGMSILAFAVVAFAALTDSAANQKARQMFGDRAFILQYRLVTDPNWTKQVGAYDGLNFIPKGTGVNTWDAAFANIQPGATATTSIGTGTVILGGLVIQTDRLFGDAKRAELVAANPTVGGWTIEPMVAAAVRGNAEQRLTEAMQELVALNPTAAKTILDAKGVSFK